ncbi:MAG: M1 family aminopeptidase [Bacteroidota bacterium]
MPLLEIYTFELSYRLRRTETYAFFLLLFAFSLFGVEFIFEGVELGIVKKNAPTVIGKTMGAIVGLFMLFISMIMSVSVLRDHRYGTATFLLVNPISKHTYLLGKFLGSLTILLGVFSALPLGMLLSEWMPWTDRTAYATFNILHYLQPFLWVSLPIILSMAALFFVTGALSKNLLIVYTQGLVVFLLFLLTKVIPSELWQAVLDPFGLSTLTFIAKDWSVETVNVSLIPWNGVMLWKNLLWSAIGFGSSVYGYRRFELMTIMKSSKKKRSKCIDTDVPKMDANWQHIVPLFSRWTPVVQWIQYTRFELNYICQQTLFWALIIAGIAIVAINFVNLGTTYGVDSLPTTYLIVEELLETGIYLFIFILLIYSSELIWKERIVNFHLIHDATPVETVLLLAAKLTAMILIYVILLGLLMVTGVLFQLMNGYHNFDGKAYLVGLFVDVLPFLVLYTITSFLFHSLVRQSFLGITLTIIFVIFNVVIAVLVTDHVLLKFGGHPLPTYSEMNGYGHWLMPHIWVKGYWLCIGVIILMLASIVKARGVATNLKKRWRSGWFAFNYSYFSIAIVVVLIGVGSFIFYNTNVLNIYWSSNKKEAFRADYERQLKAFEYLPQPKITDVQLNIELYPSKRAYHIEGSYQLINTHSSPIRAIHLQQQLGTHTHLSEVTFDRSTTRNDEYKYFSHFIYELADPLLPNDTIHLYFTQQSIPEGFENQDNSTEIVYNGSFFNSDLLPTLGYQKAYELEKADSRKRYSLGEKRKKSPQDDLQELQNSRTGSDSNGISLEAIIGTEQPQTAITSGEIINTWTENGRNYFHYKTHQKIINFYPVVSANYAAQKEQHIDKDTIDLEIYYHREHDQNIKRMMEAMTYSLDYYSSAFSAYPFPQLRIVEIPRYRDFAQAFPCTIAISESMGFVMDVDEETDVDMVFFIAAHEIAHQWWGVQLPAANVQGQKMVLETLAQYSALMVLQQKYSKVKVDQLLRQEYDQYKKGIRQQKKTESSLVLVDDEEHIYYAKGILNMYALQQAIGEEQINLALKNFLADWRGGRRINGQQQYATSNDLLSYLKKVCPEEFKRIITHLFEEVNVIEMNELLMTK